MVAEKEELGIKKKKKKDLWNQNNTNHNKGPQDLGFYYYYKFSLVSSASIEENKEFRKFADLVRGLSWRWEASLSEEANLEVIFLRIPALNLAEISGSLTLTHLTRFLFPHCRKSSGSEGCLQALWFLSSVSISALKTPTHHHENENFVNWEIPKAKTQKYRTWRILESTTWVFYRNPKKQKSKKIVKIKIKIKEEEENFGLSSVESNGAEVERKMKTSEGLFRKPNWLSWMLKKTHKRKIKDKRLWSCRRLISNLKI